MKSKIWQLDYIDRQSDNLLPRSELPAVELDAQLDLPGGYSCFGQTPELQLQPCLISLRQPHESITAHNSTRTSFVTILSKQELERWRTDTPSLSQPSPPEYALNAVNQGITALGIKATNGIVLATEKKSSSPLADQSSLSKISDITPNIGMVYSGMGPDYRVLVDRARKVSHSGYKRIYNEYPPTRILVQDVARVMQEATQSAGVRPYGVSLLVAGWDEGIEPEEESKTTEESEEKKVNRKTGGIHKGGPMLYQVDPSGSYYPWKATAIGKSATKAKTFLEKRYSEELELEDAIHIALLTLKDNIEGEMNGDSIEIGIVGAPADHLLGLEGVDGAVGPRFRKLTPQEIEDYLTSL
ncbi:proteasome subunit alpha type-2 [Fusarium bulbicola]|nr:proteasome subunit alpha type-2 [Fusarium bulbicola]